MSTGEIKIIDRVSAAEAIKRLDEEDLLFLNRLIVDRRKLLAQVKASNLMIQFSQGDRVGFQSFGWQDAGRNRVASEQENCQRGYR